MKVFNYELTKLVDMTEEQYSSFQDKLQEEGNLKKYIGRVYAKMIAEHKASLPEWKYGSPVFVRMNTNGLTSIFYETFDEFFYMIKSDGSIGWCRKSECETVFAEYFEKLKNSGVAIPFVEQIDRPFSYFS